MIALNNVCEYLETAQVCYSGQNTRYAEKQCSAGGVKSEFTCQKFTCEGGKCTFTLIFCKVTLLLCVRGLLQLKFHYL